VTEDLVLLVSVYQYSDVDSHLLHSAILASSQDNSYIGGVANVTCHTCKQYLPSSSGTVCLGKDSWILIHRRHLEGHDHAVRALAARGRTLVSGSYDCTVRIWDIVTGECKWILIGHTQKGLCQFIFPI